MNKWPDVMHILLRNISPSGAYTYPTQQTLVTAFLVSTQRIQALHPRTASSVAHGILVYT